MSEKPILFSGPMVRAILDGAKTQTRRLTPDFTQAPVEYGDGEWYEVVHPPGHGGDWARPFKPQPHAIGDTLWVRETFYCDDCRYPNAPIEEMKRELYYRADGSCCDQIPECQCHDAGGMRWRPSIHMPRWASRLSLRVTNVRVERLCAISDADARAEGAMHWAAARTDAIGNIDAECVVFRHLWDHVHGDGTWERDRARWVWVYTFEVVR